MRVGARGVVLREGKVLLVAYDDPHVGFHYNIPGGGVEQGESAREAVQRELWEEARASVTVGELLLVGEFEPFRVGRGAKTVHSLNLFFACALNPGSEPTMPDTPDSYQIALEWAPISQLPRMPILPRVSEAVAATWANHLSGGAGAVTVQSTDHYILFAG